MNSRYLLLLTLIFSCGRPTICDNPCNLNVTILPNGWTCADVIRTESILMEELADNLDDRLQTCNLENYDLLYTNDFYAAGDTTCDSRPDGWSRIVIGTAPTFQNSLPHEIVHAMQGCKPRHVQDSLNDAMHEGWHEYGIEAAIDRTWDRLARVPPKELP